MTGQQKTILVVEDERNLRVLYEQELERLGYRVLGASGGREAVDIVANEDVDLVVLDIGMPDMDGLEAMRKMLDKRRKLPVILNTAYPGFQESFQSWSAEAYVVKSGDIGELVNEIEAALSRSEARED